MASDPGDADWITVEEAADERLAAAVASRLEARGVAVRLVPAEPSDPSRRRGELTVQVPLDDFELALEALEALDDEPP
jgi:7-keto-8-aminopelargonate synthetase-like enzyme